MALRKTYGSAAHQQGQKRGSAQVCHHLPLPLNQTVLPERHDLPVRELLETVYRVVQPTLAGKGIALEIVLPQTSLTMVDAVTSSAIPIITLSAGKAENGRAIITVTDNSEGIAPDVLENIFVPFFSIKKTGSCIGLSSASRLCCCIRAAFKRSRRGEWGRWWRCRWDDVGV